MSRHPTYAFWMIAGLSTLLLLIAGSVPFSELPHRSLITFVLGVFATGIPLVSLGLACRQAIRLSRALQQLAEGQLDRPLKERRQNPGATSLNALHYKLQEIAQFIETLDEAEAATEFRSLDPDERLGKALTDIKLTLRTYRQEEEKRHWSANGLTHFADLLREHTSDMNQFSDEVVRHLVQYLGVDQGGMFVKTEAEGETYFELAACYAYDQKKHAEKRWMPGQGLVGQCALEQKTIVLTNVPDQYATITSGLGEATPSFVVATPLCWNDEIYGVVELAALTELADYQLAFLEKVAQSIAASLASLRTNIHLQELLENSRQLTNEFERLSLVANNTDNSVIIADKYGRIEFVNQGFTKLTGYTADEVLGKKPGRVLQGPDTNPETVKRISQQLKTGGSFYEEILNYRKSGESYWISLMVNPIKSEAGDIEQFISIQADVTQIKEQTLDYTHKLAAISQSNAIVEFDPYGKIVDANPLFLDMMGYQKEDILQKSHSFLLPEAEIQSPQTQMMWDNLKVGTFFSGEFKQKNKSGEERWLRGTFNPIFDLEDKLQKIMMFAQFTTYEKEKQNELAGTVQAFSETVQSFEMSPEGNLKKANALFLQNFGYKRREISRMKLADLLEAGETVPDIAPAMQQQNKLLLPLVLVTQQGGKITCRCSFTSISNLDGSLSKVLVVIIEDHR